MFNFSSISKFRTELMGMAIIGVLWGHLNPIEHYGLHIPLLNFFILSIFTAGFLFLSGFGLYYSFSKNSDIKSFYRKRITRLLIPYVIIALPFLIISFDSITIFFGKLSTLYFWVGGNFCGMWYIAVSLILYLIYPLIHKFIFKNNKNTLCRFIITIALSLAIVFSIKLLFPPYWDITKIALEKIVIFPIGMYVGYMSQQNKYISMKTIALFIILMLITSLIAMKYKFTLFEVIKATFAIPFFCILFNKYLKKDGWIQKVLCFFGKYTLEIYLLHMFVCCILNYYRIDLFYAFAISIPITLIIAKPIHNLINNHIIKKIQ